MESGRRLIVFGGPHGVRGYLAAALEAEAARLRAPGVEGAGELRPALGVDAMRRPGCGRTVAGLEAAARRPRGIR